MRCIRKNSSGFDEAAEMVLIYALRLQIRRVEKSQIIHNIIKFIITYTVINKL